jgi:hypothetical protein
LLKVAWTPSNKHIQSASGPLTHLMSLHSVRGSIVIHIHKEGVIRSQSVCNPLPNGLGPYDKGFTNTFWTETIVMGPYDMGFTNTL